MSITCLQNKHSITPHSGAGMVCDSQISLAPDGPIRTTAILHAKLPGLSKSYTDGQRSLTVINDTLENVQVWRLTWKSNLSIWLVSIFTYEFTMHFWSTANFLQHSSPVEYAAEYIFFQAMSWLELLALHSGTPSKSQTKLQTALRNRHLCLKGN